MLKNLIDYTTDREKKQKQQIINDFINPFYADYKESEELSLNQKDLQKIFQKRQEMEENLEGTPKHQLKQLFQTRSQEQKIQDVLKKASLTTLKKLKKGNEEFDILLLRHFIKAFNQINDDINKIRFFDFPHTTLFERKLFSLRRKIRKLFLRRNFYKETYEHKKQVVETLLDDIIETFLYDNQLEHYQSFKRMIYKLQLWFTKRYRPKFLDLYMMKEIEINTINRKSRDFAPIIKVIDDMFFNFFEFREHIKKMYLGEFKQDEIETSYNNLFDKIVKHIVKKEADKKIIEEANKVLGKHQELLDEATDRDLISSINYQLMPNPVTLKTIDDKEREYNEEQHFYDRSQVLELQISPMTRRKILVSIDNEQKRQEIAEFSKRVIQQQQQNKKQQQQNKKQQQQNKKLPPIHTLLRDLKNLNPKYKWEGFGYTETLPIASKILSELSNRSQLTKTHERVIDSILKRKTEKDAKINIGKSPAFGTKYPNFDSFKSQNRKKKNQQK